MAFGLAVFDTGKGKQGFIKFGRDVQQVNNPGWWKNDAIPGYQPYFRSAKKVSSGFDPSSIFGKATNKSAPFTSKDVIKKINDQLGPEFSQPAFTTSHKTDCQTSSGLMKSLSNGSFMERASLYLFLKNESILP